MRNLHIGIIVFISILASKSAVAVTVHSALLNDFENGTTSGWKYGGRAKDKPEIQPKVVEGENGNNYLQVTSRGGKAGGRGPGSRMTFINETEWRGNYNTANVGSIKAKMKNMGEDTLYMRVGFTTRTNEEWHFAASESYLELPADGEWYDLSFGISEEYITPFFGSSAECCFTAWDFDEVVGGVNQLKFHNGKEAHFWGGERVASVLGVDDIRVSSEVLQSISLVQQGLQVLPSLQNQVSAVPLPAGVWLFITGLLGVAGFSRKQKSL